MIEARNFLVPNISPDSSLHAYIQQVNSIPMLTLEEENELTERLWKNIDFAAAQRLVLSHLRLVVKVAQGFRSYNLPMQDMISEGNIGLMKAVQKFTPNLGTRLSTYAIWWIRAAIQEYILNSWSMVKVSTKAMKEKLFYNLSRAKKAISQVNNFNLHNLQTVSLNDYEDDKAPLLEQISSNEICHSEAIIARQEKSVQSKLLHEAMKTLSEREKDILVRRRLKNTPEKLSDIAKEYGISQERVRQIEEKIMIKLKRLVNEFA